MIPAQNKWVACLGMVIATSFLAFTPTAEAAHIKAFLLGGQSNMDGRAATSGLPTSPVNLQNPQTDVKFYFQTDGNVQGANENTVIDLQPGMSETSGFGPEISFGRDVADAFATENFALIKYGNGGTSLVDEWDPNTGGEYSTFISTVTAGLTALENGGSNTTEIVGMLWTQGERDAVEGRTTTQYETDLNEFIAAIRGNYGAGLPFFLSRLSSGQTSLNTTSLNAIRAAQDLVAAGDPNAYLIDTDGFSIAADNLHFDADGQQALGSAFATSYIDTVVTSDVPEPSTAILAIFGLTSFCLRRRRLAK
ncbi:MAG: sialate O-acetylesterase [Lentisphaeria bacterium]|nr:sialate O-acetylesterase [Lentisphaeria bacterium]